MKCIRCHQREAVDELCRPCFKVVVEKAGRVSEYSVQKGRSQPTKVVPLTDEQVDGWERFLKSIGHKEKTDDKQETPDTSREG